MVHIKKKIKATLPIQKKKTIGYILGTGLWARSEVPNKDKVQSLHSSTYTQACGADKLQELGLLLLEVQESSPPYHFCFYPCHTTSLCLNKSEYACFLSSRETNYNIPQGKKHLNWLLKDQGKGNEGAGGYSWQREQHEQERVAKNSLLWAMPNTSAFTSISGAFIVEWKALSTGK